MVGNTSAKDYGGLYILTNGDVTLISPSLKKKKCCLFTKDPYLLEDNTICNLILILKFIFPDGYLAYNIEGCSKGEKVMDSTPKAETIYFGYNFYKVFHVVS